MNMTTLSLGTPSMSIRANPLPPLLGFNLKPSNGRLSLGRAVITTSVLKKQNVDFVRKMNVSDCFRVYQSQKHNKQLIYHRMKVKADATNGNDGYSTTWSFKNLCVAAVVFVAVPGVIYRQYSPVFPARVPFSVLDYGLEDKDVNGVQVMEGSRDIKFNLNSSSQNGRSNSHGGWQFVTRNIEDSTLDLLKRLKKDRIPYGSELSFFVAMMNFIKQVAFVLNACYQLTAQSKITPTESTSNTFDDIKGADDAKFEFQEIVKMINGDLNYKELGASMHRGVLLTGPPGTGKTLLARILAGEARVPIFSRSGSEFVNVYAGQGAAHVRELFREARKRPFSIIFIDEIDAIGGKRGTSLDTEHPQTLNQLLIEMDGFEENNNILVIAATNRPETLDPALMRSGRFCKKIHMGVPDKSGQRDILAMYLEKKPMEENMADVCKQVASHTRDLVGADIKLMVNEACHIAARRGSKFLTQDDILKAAARLGFIVPKRASWWWR